MTTSLNHTPATLMADNSEVQQASIQSPVFDPVTSPPGATLDSTDHLKPDFEPWALCPKSGKLVLALQAYVLHTTPVDTCAGCGA